MIKIPYGTPRTYEERRERHLKQYGSLADFPAERKGLLGEGRTEAELVCHKLKVEIIKEVLEKKPKTDWLKKQIDDFDKLCL